VKTFEVNAAGDTSFITYDAESSTVSWWSDRAEHQGLYTITLEASIYTVKEGYKSDKISFELEVISESCHSTIIELSVTQLVTSYEY
jgi:hypothetical protein